MLLKIQLRWAGHVARMEDHHLPKIILYGELSSGLRNIGAPKKRYEDTLKKSFFFMHFVPTNYLLYKMKKVSSQTCTFYNLEPETIEHLFFQCIHVKDIWWYVFEEWAKLTGNTYEPNLRGCLLGVYNNNVDDTRTINTIVLIVKAYIMKCKYEQSAV